MQEEICYGGSQLSTQKLLTNKTCFFFLVASVFLTVTHSHIHCLCHHLVLLHIQNAKILTLYEMHFIIILILHAPFIKLSVTSEGIS